MWRSGTCSSRAPCSTPSSPTTLLKLGKEQETNKAHAKSRAEHAVELAQLQEQHVRTRERVLVLEDALTHSKSEVEVLMKKLATRRAQFALAEKEALEANKRLVETLDAQRAEQALSEGQKPPPPTKPPQLHLPSQPPPPPQPHLQPQPHQPHQQQCVVCFDVPDVVVLPCMHLICCKMCLAREYHNDMLTCVLCSTRVTGQLKILLP